MAKQKTINALFGVGVLVLGLFMFGATVKAGWPTVEIPIAVIKGSQDGAKIISDEKGGSIIAWEDGRSESETRFYAQRLDSNGNIKWKKMAY